MDERCPSVDRMVRKVEAHYIRYTGSLNAAIRERLLPPDLIPPDAVKWRGAFLSGRQVSEDECFHRSSAEVILGEDQKLTIYLWAHIKDGVLLEPPSLAHLPVNRGLRVIALPTAAAEVVVNPSRRRGRLPSPVVPASRLRAARDRRAYEAAQPKTGDGYVMSAETQLAGLIKAREYLDAQIASMRHRLGL